MSDFATKKIEYRIKSFISKYKESPREVIVFGQNGYTKFIVEYLRKNEIEVNAIFDNNEQKQNSVYEGIQVLAPSIRFIAAYVVISSAYYLEMKSQLIEMGYEECNIFDLQRGNCSKDLVEMDIIENECREAKFGYSVYRKINKTDSLLFVAPVGSVGDIYLLCLYFEQYLLEKNIDKYILAIPGQSGMRLAKSFGYNAIVVTQEQANALIKYRLVMGTELSKVYVLHCGYVHIRVACYMLMYKGKTWIDNYASVLFQLKEKKRKTFNWPQLPYDEKQKLTARGFEEGNTVIISPYANTLTDLNITFWKGLVIAIKKLGFKCFTNVTRKDKEIEGTERLEVGIEYMNSVVDMAGYFVGLRSGLCDIISHSKAKKVVLYTQEKFETIKVIDFYSLKKMGLCDDSEEFEVSYNIEQDIESVVSRL